jgi:hypothetical protein
MHNFDFFSLFKQNLVVREMKIFTLDAATCVCVCVGERGDFSNKNALNHVWWHAA